MVCARPTHAAKHFGAEILFGAKWYTADLNEVCALLLLALKFRPIRAFCIPPLHSVASEIADEAFDPCQCLLVDAQALCVTCGLPLKEFACIRVRE